MNFLDVIVMRPLILQGNLLVFHVESIRITCAEAPTGSQLRIEGNLMIDKVCCHVLKLYGWSILLVDSIEKINQVGDEFEPFVKVGSLKDFKHDFNKLIEVSFLVGQNIEVFRYLKKLNGIQIID